jgi:hypothetical protein
VTGTVPERVLRGADALAARLGVGDGRSLLNRAPRTVAARDARWSAGGTCRAVRCLDGWWVLNLARPEDHELISPLVGEPTSDAWTAVDSWAADRTVTEVAERGWLLGLASGIVGRPPPGGPVLASRHGAAAAVPSRPHVVCLAALWAGPLCAHLLGRLGWEVTFVSSVRRPDPMRSGDPQLYAQLHDGHAHLELDLPRGLQAVLGQADVVIEGSRPRALQQWGIDPARHLASGACRTWVSLTGHGRAHGDRVGFGDDTAMVGGLLRWAGDGTPRPVGDALADPLAGLHAAAAAHAAVAAGGGILLDVALARVAADAAA